MTGWAHGLQEIRLPVFSLGFFHFFLYRESVLGKAVREVGVRTGTEETSCGAGAGFGAGAGVEEGVPRSSSEAGRVAEAAAGAVQCEIDKNST